MKALNNKDNLSFISRHSIFTIISFITVFLLLFGCADSDKNEFLKISGNINFDNSLKKNSGTLFVVIAKGSEINALIENVEETIIAVYPVNNTDGFYNIDLSDTVLKAGDEIIIIGFYDYNYNNNIPSPDKGDYIGFHYNNETMQAVYKLKEVGNFNIDFDVNRKVYDWEGSVSGKIKSDYTGNVIVIGYKGEINSLDFTRLDFDKIIAYDLFTKSSPEMSYNLSIMPYGFDLPVENVYFFAIFDANKNNRLDGGEWLGYYSDNLDKIPDLLSITAEKKENIDIFPMREVKPASNEALVLSGSITMPYGYEKADKKDCFIIISKPVNPDEMIKSLSDNILYFERLPENTKNYSIDLAKIGIKKGESVGIVVLWDKDYDKGFPMLTSGDFIGYYFNNEDMTIHYQLMAGDNNNLDIIVEKEVFSDEKTIRGTIRESDAIKSRGLSYSGDLVVFAYKGDISSLDYSQLDYDKIIGFKKLVKADSSDMSYEMKLLPFGNELPINRLYLFALYDKNKNGKPDGGEYFGCHSINSDGIPMPVTITELSDDDIDITIVMEIPVASVDKIYISGSIIMPPLYVGADNTTAFVLVFHDANPEDIIESKINDIVYFEQIPENETYYHINLSGTELVAGDRIGIFVLWDKDNLNIFPELSRGDFAGYYIDQLNMTNMYSLVSGSNPNIDINVNKEVFDFDKIISGNIINDELTDTSGTDYQGQVVLFAYSGEFDSFSFTHLDYENIVAYKKIEKNSSGSLPYELKILPFGNQLPINNVYLFALYDDNKNGRADSGEYYGYYMNSSKMPEVMTISATEPLAGSVDIKMIRKVPVPSGKIISLKGKADFKMLKGLVKDGFDLSSENQEAFVIITDKLNSQDESLNDVIGSIGKSAIYFEKIQGALINGMLSYDIDLSKTGLNIGDKIGVALLWENDFVAGFPLISSGDYIGVYQDKANYEMSFPLLGGVNDITPLDGLEPYEGWHFNINRKIYFNSPYKDIGFNFIVKSRIYKLKGGDTLIFIAVQDTGVAGSDIDTDYAVIMDISFIEGTGEVAAVTKTAYLLPGLLETIVNEDIDGGFLSIEKVKIVAFVDKNNNRKFDHNDIYGYYNKIHSGLTMSELNIPFDPEDLEIIIPLVLKK